MKSTNQNQITQSLLWVQLSFFMFLIFLMDIFTPKGFNLGYFYIIPIFIAVLILKNKYVPLIFCLISCLFISISYTQSNYNLNFSLNSLLNHINSVLIVIIGTIISRLYRNSILKIEEINNNIVKKLKQSNQDLEEFAYIVSHDLKSPLRGIANLTSWIEEDSNIDNEGREHLGKIKKRITLMERLLDDLLQYSRIGRVEHENETIQLNQLVQDIITSLDAPKEFNFKINNLPNLLGEKVLLDIILRNLISNSIKHRRSDSGQIEVSAIEKDKSIIIEVSDNGIGIPKHLHEKAFTMFQTLKPKDQSVGTGMGLALVRRTVVQQGGTIELQSDKDEGAKFIITLPRKVA